LSFWNGIFGRKGKSREPEKKRLEGSALVGTNVLDLERPRIEPPEEKKVGNLAVWFLKIPLLSYGREPMVIDKVGRYIYAGHSPYRFDFEGNPKGRLRLPRPWGGLAVSHDGKVLLSTGSWLYRVDVEGQVISAVQSGWFNSIDVLPDGTIAGVRHYRTPYGEDKSVLGFVQEEKIREVDVSKIMVWGDLVRSSPDGFLYVVGGPAFTTFVGNTVFKLDPAGHLVNSCAIFKNIGAICPTHDGGIDVVEMDGSRLVRLSREMKVVYDSQRDSRPEAGLLFRPPLPDYVQAKEVLEYVQAMDMDDAGNCYVMAHGVLTRFRQFWAEPLGREEATPPPETPEPQGPWVGVLFEVDSFDEVFYGRAATANLLEIVGRQQLAGCIIYGGDILPECRYWCSAVHTSSIEQVQRIEQAVGASSEKNLAPVGSRLLSGSQVPISTLVYQGFVSKDGVYVGK
jgi:hypothetical protein